MGLQTEGALGVGVAFAGPGDDRGGQGRGQQAGTQGQLPVSAVGLQTEGALGVGVAFALDPQGCECLECLRAEEAETVKFSERPGVASAAWLDGSWRRSQGLVLSSEVRY